MDLKARAKQLKRDVPAVFLCLGSKDTPWTAKAAAALTVAYALSPVDLIPDFIPVLGYLDDVLILPALVAFTVSLIPKETFESYRAQAEGMWAEGRPKKWYFAVPIVLLWLLVLFLIFRPLLTGGK